MKMLERKYIFRLTYFDPAPTLGCDYTFHILASSVAMAIEDLCRTKGIRRELVRETNTICPLEAISDEYLDTLISQNVGIWLQRSEANRKLYQDYIDKNPGRPTNVSKVADDSMIFSTL